MPVYIWEGVTKQGQIRKGQREVPNEAVLTRALRAQGIQVKKIAQKGSLASVGKIFQKAMSGVKEVDIVIFSRQFSTMINAGLPLIQCLDILQKQQKSKTFSGILLEVKNDVEAGATFADSLAKHPKAFDTLFVSLVAAGEVGGILDVILGRVAAYLEKAIKLKRQIKGAMVYPSVILCVALIVILVLMTWVIPIFERMFQSFAGSKLPKPTQMVIDASHWTQNNLFIIIGLLIAAYMGYKQFRATKKGTWFIHSTALKLPLFGDLIRKVLVARFARTMGTMIASGVPILDSMDIVARSAGNVVIEAAIRKAREAVSEGRTMAEPIQESKIFPSMVSQMISVGEATGALDQMMNKIADFYEEEVDAAVAALTSMLEPIMMVFLGGIIGGLVLVMYLPIFELAGTLQNTS